MLFGDAKAFVGNIVKELSGNSGGLYREIRVENEFTDGDGTKASLKQGAEVDVIVEADPDAIVTKPTTSDKGNTEKP